ncbi:unnamed protein product [Brassica oleracea]
MRHYDKLSEVSYNPKITAWRFRVKIHRIYPFYSYVTSSGPFYTYVLADEEVRVKSSSLDFLITCLEKQEGKWVEIFRVEVKRSYPGFQATNSRFNLSASRHTQVYIIDPLNNRHFMDFKNIHAIPHMDHRDRNYPIDTMEVVFNTEAHFDAPASARMEFYIRDNIRTNTPIIPAIWVLIGFGDELGDAHPAPTLTRYSRSSYSSPATGHGR